MPPPRLDVNDGNTDKTLSRAGNRAQVGLYLGLLTLALAMGSPLGALTGIPVAYLLKDNLHLSPQAMAAFGAITAIPTYLGFLFGFLRDRWRPFGKGDRGYLLLTAPLAVAVYLWLASGRITYGRLLAGVLIGALIFQVLGTAVQALTASVAQQRGMTGRLGALSVLAMATPTGLAALAGGWLTSHTSPRGLFLIAATVTAVIGVLALSKPTAVFGGQPEAAPQGEDPWQAVVRICKHRPLWPAALLWALWNFGLCSGTPLFLFLTSTVKLSSEAYGTFLAILNLGFVPTAALYGLVCRRQPLGRMLWWGIGFAIFQCVPLLAIHDAPQALMAGALVGLLGGFATATFTDLLIRSCPEGLEGTAMMLFGSGAALVIGASNLCGTWLYTHGGFGLSVWATVAVYALMAPVLLLVPRSVVAVREGEALTQM